MSTQKKFILVVEDNAIAARSAQVIFKNLGCQTELVEDGDKAVELVQKNHYDAIYMDIGLPTVSGLQACVAIREHEAMNQLPSIPIVAVTGNNSPEETKRYMEAGMQDVIDKPLTIEKAKHLLSFCNQGHKNS
jgi:two-component system, OmpR family, aerobic respiration control sensor histidine kinase ArcB